MNKVLGIDIGATFIKAVLIDSSGNILERKKVETGSNFKEISKQIVSISDQINDHGAIGIGIPGTIDRTKGTIVSTVNIKEKSGFKIGKIISEETGKKVLIENDANCATIVESVFGGGQGIDNFICLTLGTGIGGGIVIDGKLYVGNGSAGEIGHMSIGNKYACGLGHTGCLEGYCSIKNIAKEIGLKENNAQEIYLLAKKGDKKAKSVYDLYGRYLAIGLANIGNILNPELIVLAGGVSKAANLFLPATKKELKNRTMSGLPSIKIAKFRDWGGAIGAASLFFA